MKTLIVEDDFISRVILQEFLKGFGTVHIAVNGEEGGRAFRPAMEAGEPYDLVCLDIMMPKMDGQRALKEIRADEEARGILSSNGAKIVMTTALDDFRSVSEAYGGLCDSYLVKPVDKSRFL